ncbi:hypothetical protein DCE93_11945 [Agromyces badenianii]|uniref:Restriction endonuclease n=1 Tax=Agromyces badenianii TaxID=2080742 RepID=A0A2S0WYA5_9MICO|nr:hypothetical protein DCE93_11945 [Agromyces badenianii]
MRIDSLLMRAPVALASAPAIPNLDLLPFTALDWPTFEKLQLRVMTDVLGLRDPRQYGDPGQNQQAIDLIATAADGTGTALQSKNYTSFVLSDLKAAVKRFRDTERPFAVGHLVIGVSSLVRRTEIIAELKKLQGELAPVRLDLWDAQRLSDLLRNQHEIVAQFFTVETARQFCGDFEVNVPIIPNVDARIISDAVTMPPETLTGAQELLDEAEKSTDPSEAISLMEQAQEKLRKAGFDAYASRHEPARAKLMVQVGREQEAARQILDEVWAALDRGRTGNAQITFNRMRTLAEMLPDSTVLSDYEQVGSAAFELYMQPLGYLPEPSSLLIGAHVDRVRLMLLAGETALALDNLHWLRSASGEIAVLAEDRTLPDVLRVRLRLLVAEAKDDWAPLLDEARRKRLRSELTPLVTARYARYCAIRQQFQAADENWEQAASLASLVRQWDDAGTWLLSKRAYLSNWRPFSENDLIAMEIALGEQQYPTPPVIPRAVRAYEEAHEASRQGNARSAAIAAQRALRDAVASGDWSGERKARTVLAAVMQAADEPQRAAIHLARAGEGKKAEALGKAYPNRFIDVIGELGAETYWNVGTAYRLIATQADVVPDARVDEIATHIISDLRAAGAGKLIDVTFFASSRYNNAIKALAGLGLRLSKTDADAALGHFEDQPEVQPNHYRYHDEDEAVAVARIARAHPSLAPRAIAHLVALLARASGARKNVALEALAQYPDLARPALKAVDVGNGWAQEMLAYADPTDIDETAAAAALGRLTTPLEHVEGLSTVGSNAIGDSLLLAGQPQDALARVIREMMGRADDARVSGFDRGSYLTAAANLARGLGDESKKQLFPDAARLAEKSTPSTLDEFDRQFSHPLGTFRLNISGSDRRGHATFLASLLVVSDNDREEVRRLAYLLLGSDSDFYPTQALQNLGEVVKDDIAFLAGQGWAMRSLASILWVRYGGPPHVGARLAADEDARVRQALASSLAEAHAEPSQEFVRAQLATDPSSRVRRALGGMD